MFIVIIVILILLKMVFWQTSINIQSLVKILWRSEKDKITFKAIEIIGMASEKLYQNTWNRPFPGCPKHLFQSEAKSEILMKIKLILTWKVLHLA